MSPRTLALFAFLFVTSAAFAQSPKHVATAGNGADIPHPTSTTTYAVQTENRTVQVPAGMVYIPAGECKIGADSSAKTVHLDGFCIGKFAVTNAEYKAFLDATGSTSYPHYWSGSMYPEGKGNHPVVYVSLTKARAYCDWVSQKTGWKVAIPTADQWEKAARGPKGFLYPWGNTTDVVYTGGKLTSKFNFNAVTAAHYLQTQPELKVKYNNKKSKYFGDQTTVAEIAGYDDAGNATRLAVGPTGSVKGWVSHATYTGFIYTDLFTSLNEVGGNTSPVGSYESGKSAYGCYDMAGNVWNWCNTLIFATNGAEKGQHVNEIRGGSWYATGRSCVSISIGEGRAASGAYNTVGFRVVMVPGAR